ncbi:hypothetical protein L9F63_012796, partial [Diploptera punctata]
DVKVEVKCELGDENGSVGIKCEMLPALDPLAPEETDLEVWGCGETFYNFTQSPQRDVRSFRLNLLNIEEDKWNGTVNTLPGMYISSHHLQRREKVVLCKFCGNENIIHHMSKLSKCPVCNKSSIETSKNITDIHINSNEKTLKCPVCNKAFGLRGDFNRHLNTHSNEKPFKCSDCNKSFVRKGDLNIHYLRIHTNDKPFKCLFCNKSFALRGEFNTHLRIHNNADLFKCIVCSKTFSHEGNLKLHMRIHSNEKPFECFYCNMFFTRKGDLKAHLCTHSNENHTSVLFVINRLPKSPTLRYIYVFIVT